MDHYLINKRRKIQDIHAESAQVSALFKGKCFYLNGYLDGAGYSDFQELIVTRGGIVYSYLAPKVTHIIASTMTNSKLKQIKKPIIRPDWIHDCIKHDQILPIHNYLLSLGRNMILDFKKTDTPAVFPDEAFQDEAFQDGELNLDDPFIRKNTTLDPDFLVNFFGKSRLHHLTNWKYELIDYVNKELKIKLFKKSHQKWFMHIDLDAFFVTASLLDKPQLKDLPVVIAHSTEADDSTSEIASCNYVARSFGIKNGMRLASAKEKCKDLKILPYDFPKYKKVSMEFFNVLIRHSDQIQVNSCDEAFIDVSSILESGREILETADMIRNDVFKATGGCTASVGCGPNMLLARLATYKAKPNGSFLVEESQIESFMINIPIDQLPGIGWSYQEKMQNKKIWNCGDVKKQSLLDLQRDLGLKTGEMLYKFSRGIDERKLENRGRQSLGVDINWGVRFQNQSQISDFFKQLTDYVSERLKDSRVKASHITVKAKKRLYKGEPTKFLGCGHCDNLSKSKSMSFSNDSQKLFDVGYSLLCQLSVNPMDLRGIGISLKNFDQDSSGNSCSPVKKIGERQESIIKYLSPIKAGPSKTYQLLQAETVDPDVLKELPTQIQHEIQKMLQTRDGFTTPEPKRKDSKKKSKDRDESKNQISHLDELSPELMSNPGKYQTSDFLSLPSDYDPSVFKALPSSIQRELRGERQKIKLQTRKELDLDNLMPSSSQIDQSVLKELPESIRKEILAKKYIRTNRSRDMSFMSRIRGAQREFCSTTSSKMDILLVSKTIYPDLGGERDPLAIYEMLNDWVSSAASPQEEALEEFMKYLSDLVHVGDLVRVRNVYLCIKRLIDLKYGEANAVWLNAISKVFTEIGQIIYQKYGAQLKMNM